MSPSSLTMRPELRLRIQAVARQCRRARRARCRARFALATLLCTALATGLFWLVPPDAGGRLVFAGYLLAELAAMLWFYFLPLRKPITDEQVALFIDERHPELQDRMISAVEFSANLPEEASAWIAKQFLEETTPLVRHASLDDVLRPGRVRVANAAGWALLGLAAAILIATGNLWVPNLSIETALAPRKAAPLPFTVEPGNARVRMGDNQMVWVRSDIAGAKVTLHSRAGVGEWLAVEMPQGDSAGVYYHYFADIREDTEYRVELGRRESEPYRLTVWTPPQVEGIDLTYTYPDYLQRPAQEVPNSGNISAIEGTNVALEVRSNKAIARAEMVLDGGERVALESADSTRWHTRLTLAKNDRYRIELTDAENVPSEYNPDYSITVERDRPPDISVDFPRGDSEVTMLEEVPFRFAVSDDYGFSEYGIQYEIEGKEPVRLALNTSNAPVTDADGRHELRLEDLGIQTGDLVTWSVWAKDAKPGRKDFEQLGDPFFLEIRPFLMRYTESISGGDGQAPSQGAMEGDLEALQKQVIIATWNLRREAGWLTDEEFKTNLATIVETQSSLLEKVSGGAGMMANPKPELIILKDAMDDAVKALGRAALPSPEDALSEAAVAERRAFQMILKMKPREAEVQQQQGGGGGGGGERPDIQALDMDRNQNFYENENTTQQQQQAADALLNKIKDLAQRQSAVNDEIAKLISELQAAKNEAEKDAIKRKLEKLQEELKKNLEHVDEMRQDLAQENLGTDQARDAREALQQARKQMNRSLEQLKEEEFQQARSSGSRAIDALKDMEERLQQFSRGAAAQRMAQLQQELQGLKENQKAIENKADELRKEFNAPSLDNREAIEEEKEKLLGEKDKIAEDFTKMMGEASELAERSQASQELMSRKLGDWLRETSKDGIVEEMEESKPLVNFGAWDTAVEAEQRVGRKLDSAAEKLDEVAGLIVEDDLEGMQKALQALDELHQETQVGREQVARNENADGEPDEQGAAKPGEEGEQPAPQPGGEPSEQPTGQPGEQPSESAAGQPGAQDGQQPSESSQDSSTPGQSPSPSSQDGEGTKPGESQSSQPQDGSQGPGGRNPQSPSSQSGMNSGGGSRWTAGNMDEFIGGEAQQWLEQLRTAESLLPQDSPFRRDVAGVREEIEGMRRMWRDRALAPKYDLFLNMVERPLAETAGELQREIQRQMNEKEFVLVDDGDIPERYKDRVAGYFKGLAEAEGAQK